MENIFGAGLLAGITVFSLGILMWFFVSTKKAFNKLDRLDNSVLKKLLLVDRYMIFARQFTKDELIKISKLPDDEIMSFNKIHDMYKMIESAKEKMTNPRTRLREGGRALNLTRKIRNKTPRAP